MGIFKGLWVSICILFRMLTVCNVAKNEMRWHFNLPHGIWVFAAKQYLVKIQQIQRKEQRVKKTRWKYKCRRCMCKYESKQQQSIMDGDFFSQLNWLKMLISHIWKKVVCFCASHCFQLRLETFYSTLQAACFFHAAPTTEIAPFLHF